MATWISLSRKIHLKEIFAALMILLAIVFFRSERSELQSIWPQITHADSKWIITGCIVTIIYILFQASIYRQTFAAIGIRIQWFQTIPLFLKRNLLSVFLPAGGISSLAYTPSQIRNAGLSKMQVHQASGLYGFVNLLSVLIVGIPIIVISVLQTPLIKSTWTAVIATCVFILLLIITGRSIKRKGWLFTWLERRFPAITPALHDLFVTNFQPRQFFGALAYAVGIEFCGILHVFIAMLALGVPAHIGAAASGYIIAVLMMIISPFLKGLGAVELSMVYVLQKAGYTSAEALSITLLFRIFEFWLPFFSGVLAFAWKGRHIFLRIAPALLTFSLGIVNIISAITPPIRERLTLLREYLPLEAIHASNLLTLLVGLSLLVTSAFLFRGFRTAWLIALTLSFVSLIGHLGKALDYEEATIAGFTVLVLLFTSSQYQIKGSNKWMRVGIQTALTSWTAVTIFTFISFYFIDEHHFGVNFTWQQSLLQTGRMFLLVSDSTLHPVTRFAHEFIALVRILGLFTWGFLFFSLFRLAKPQIEEQNEVHQKATLLVEEFGTSAMDHFKLNKDKLHYFSASHDGFIAYRLTSGFAVVLEEPVCANENKIDIIKEFDQYCVKKGMKPVYYRVDEDSLRWFGKLKKRKLMIGQEAILDTSKFSLTGKDKKSLRNGINSLQHKGYKTVVHLAPQNEKLLNQLEKISDEWLTHLDREELVFSQGMFDKDELNNQDIITVEDNQGIIKAYLNVIPDYAEAECTYDMIRNSADAPGAAPDALIVKMVEYVKEKQQMFLNLGLVPMSGISEPTNTPEQVIQLAASRLKRFRHYKGLKAFKEKYATLWENKYLVYDHDFDLLQLPVIISKVMKP